MYDENNYYINRKEKDVEIVNVMNMVIHMYL